jgi:hypothetical protein
MESVYLTGESHLCETSDNGKLDFVPRPIGLRTQELLQHHSFFYTLHITVVSHALKLELEDDYI